MDNKDYYLIINDQKVPVTEEVYRAYSQGHRKERYMTKDLKTGRLAIANDSIVEIPSREDSYDRLLELDRQFPDTRDLQPEDVVCKAEMLQALEKALHTLTDEELALIQEIFYLERSEREIGRTAGTPPTTVHSRKNAILKKLRKKLEKDF